MNDEWEEVPTEDLWQDGEITPNEMPHLLYENIIEEGKWKIVRRREWKPINRHKQTPTVL